MSAAEGKRAAPTRRRAGGVFVPHEPGKLQRTVAWLLYALISAIAVTLRYTLRDRTRYFGGAAKGPAIYCVWHNRLALCLPVYRKFARPQSRTPGMAAMASASKDGAFLAAVIQKFGVQAARGSSSRRGSQALLELTSWAERGYDLAITPDGPRGPRYHAQPGVVSLAQVTGLPILPCTYNLTWKIRIRSWDGFQVPLPFSRCEILVGTPITVPRDASDEVREDARRKLEADLRELSKD